MAQADPNLMIVLAPAATAASDHANDYAVSLACVTIGRRGTANAAQLAGVRTFGREGN